MRTPSSAKWPTNWQSVQPIKPLLDRWTNQPTDKHARAYWPSDSPAYRHLCTQWKRISCVSSHDLFFWLLTFDSYFSVSLLVRRFISPSFGLLVTHLLLRHFPSSICTPLMHQMWFILRCFNDSLELDRARKKELKMIPHALPCFFIFCMENISSQNFLHFYCRQDIILIWSSDIQAVPVYLTTSCYCTYL